jgi:hypothetical protein
LTRSCDEPAATGISNVAEPPSAIDGRATFALPRFVPTARPVNGPNAFFSV